MTPTASAKSSATSGFSLTLLLACLVILVATVVVVIFLVQGSDVQEQKVAPVHTEVAAPVKPAAPAAPVIDTTETRVAQAVVGQRYKVLIIDETDEGKSGLARIGGLVTLVPDAQVGDVAIIEVTHLHDNTGEAALIERLESGRSIPGRPAQEPVERVERPRRPAPEPVKTPTPEPTTRDYPVMLGSTYEVTVTERDRREPDVNGVARIEGLVIFVPGTEPGDRVRIRITDIYARAAKAEVVERLSSGGAEP